MFQLLLDQMVDISETLALFVELQTLGDRNLRKLCFSHVVHSIRRMNKKHKNDAQNRALQNILFSILQVRLLILLLFYVVHLLRPTCCCVDVWIFLGGVNWCNSKRTKQEQRDRSSHYVSFTGGRCGSMIELQMRFVWLVFIHHQGMHTLFVWLVDL